VNFLPENLCLLATLCSSGTRNVLIIKTENPGKIIAVCYAKQQDLVGFLRRNGHSGGIILQSPTGEPHNTDSKPGHAGNSVAHSAGNDERAESGTGKAIVRAGRRWIERRTAGGTCRVERVVGFVGRHDPRIEY
jgi:hypothetical protein